MTEEGRRGYPRRVICLAGEAADLLRRMGAGERVMDLSGAAPRPDGVIEGLLALGPDLVLASPGLSGGPAPAPVPPGVPFMAYDPGGLEDFLRTVRDLGEVMGLQERARALAEELEAGVLPIRERGEMLLRRPRIFFEECPDPLISCSRWVGDLVEIAGGEEIFPELRGRRDRQARVVDPAEVVRREPEVIVASWSGERVDFERIRSRPGWDRVPAVRREKMFEIEPDQILRPGAAALTEGLARLHEIIAGASLG
jgi:iron complex transport system substrate-binding protein